MPGSRSRTTTSRSKAPRRKPAAKADKRVVLRQMLEQRRIDLQLQVENQKRDVRTESHRESAVRGHGEDLQVDVQEGVSLALMQLQSQTLVAIDSALKRLEQGRYGICTECHEDIAPARLKALPFAVRCRDCEETIEQTKARPSVTSSWQDPM